MKNKRSLLTGSKQEGKPPPKRAASLQGALRSLLSRINETQTAADTCPPSVLRNACALAQEERALGLFIFPGERWKPSAPSSPPPSAVPVRPAAAPSNKAAPSASPKAPAPTTRETLKAEEREFSCYAAVPFVPSSLSDPCFVLN